MDIEKAAIRDLVASLDLARKVRLLTGCALFALHAEPEIGLASLKLSDGPTGVRGAELRGGTIACVLPNATLLAQHWDTALAHEVGEVLADEAAAQQVHVVLGPTINLHRTPLGGRLFEAYSEDPLLTGALAAAYVRGLQGKGIAATPKHYVANESETERRTASSELDEKTLREVYLLPFEIVVEDASPWAIMAAYNKVNGIPATEHTELIEGVLKGEWGFDGLIMSDWFATRSTAESANGGLDLVMPGPGGPWEDRLVAAVEAGEVAESAIDDHLGRLLLLASRTGALGEQRSWPSDLPAPDSEVRREQLRRFAAGGMTVLTNNGVLPLDSPNVALIGRHAVETVAQGGGSAGVRPPHVISIADGLTSLLGDRVSVVDGVEVRFRHASPGAGVLRDIRATTFGASGEVLASREMEIAELAAYGGWAQGAASIEVSGEVVLSEPTRLQVGFRGFGDWTLEVAGESHAMRLAWADGIVEEALLKPPFWTTEVLLSPGDRITARVREAAALVGLITRPVPRPPAEVIGAAVRAAREADVAVVVVGLTEEQETEGFDKTTLVLPGEQDALVAAVAAAAQRTVVVVNAATPVLMPWLAEVDAVLWAGLPGQEAGDAVAAALLGHVEPAGRLVTTFPRTDSDALTPVPTDGALPYDEGTAIGYRGASDPLFWFGHGLGYTTWEYGEASFVDGTVSVRITNTGSRPGREVVQVYLRPRDEPVRLAGWAVADVATGETVQVEVPCSARVRRVWADGWQPLRGGEVLIARGLGDVRVVLPADQE
ncbi:glycoside hydrolase family 3 C-terminal domain-containing protein [Lentzea sp. BCCO 10_0856]|uniref:Glycoside hydrolase family 3 C-terminal domain-containing protein n=1 Tax=Lentzea miocenica TaxID=3095431 RepID=A0ABU4ST06_9PSEU|nr:glycoside hydrolase family 3 C-terminal domain-containing protein [Lentzea sp. BCCO 10_0856]MDX8029028.1 glycoside hydrolase family 3 C-terminal domain-containing protein [Lentzea sp. BCCO 10_0856]